MNPILKQASETAAFLAEALPENYEILVFDLTQKGFPTAAGSRTRSGHAEDLRQYVNKLLRSKTVVENGRLTRRADVSIGNKLYRSSVQLIKDPEGTPVAALVLALELSSLMAMHGMLNSLLSFDTTDLAEIAPVPATQEIQEPTLELIERMVAEFTDAPERMSSDERAELLMDLYETGVFSLKGAVSRAAFCMEMSEQSVYRYLAKIRRARGE